MIKDEKNVKIRMSEKCINCGVYLEFADVFAEEDNGRVYVKNNGIFTLDSNKVKLIDEICPVEAIIIKSAEVDEDSRKKLLQELRIYMDYKYPLPSYSDVDFKDCKTSFEYSCSVHSSYEYSSESAAEREGQRELKRGLFDRMDNIGKHILHDYQEQVLSRILTYQSKESNYAYKMNKQLTSKFNELVTKARIVYDELSLPNNFCVIDISPDFSRSLENRNASLMMLKQIAETSLVKYMAENVEGPSWYDIYVNTDSMDVYAGTDRHGYTKTKEKYAYDLMEAVLKVKEHYFANVDSAIKEYVSRALNNIAFREVYNPIQNEVRSKAKKLYEELTKDNEQTKKEATQPQIIVDNSVNNDKNEVKNIVQNDEAQLMRELDWALTRLSKPCNERHIKKIQKLADEGFAPAQLEFAKMLHEGTYVPESAKRAIDYYNRAASKGCLEAQLYLAECHMFGIGMKQSDIAAAQWYIKAANQGDDGAQWKCVELYEKGCGVSQNQKKADEWRVKAMASECAKENICNNKTNSVSNEDLLSRESQEKELYAYIQQNYKFFVEDKEYIKKAYNEFRERKRN